MKDQLKEDIDKSREKIREINKAIDNKSEELSTGNKQLWQDAKARLSEIHDKLGEASGHFVSKTDDAALQAHLATMEAHDKWQNISKIFEKLTDKTVSQTKNKLDHAALKSHLAKMDAGDFMETTGNTIVHNFKVSRNKVENTTVACVKDMEGYFNRIAKSFKHDT